VSSRSTSKRAAVIVPLASASRSALPSGGSEVRFGWSEKYGMPLSSHAPGLPPSGSMMKLPPLPLVQPHLVGVRAGLEGVDDLHGARGRGRQDDGRENGERALHGESPEPD